MKTHNLTIKEAISFLEKTLKKMENDPRGELTEIDSDTAFELGYKVAIADLKACTSDPPKGK